MEMNCITDTLCDYSTESRTQVVHSPGQCQRMQTVGGWGSVVFVLVTGLTIAYAACPPLHNTDTIFKATISWTYNTWTGACTASHVGSHVVTEIAWGQTRSVAGMGNDCLQFTCGTHLQGVHQLFLNAWHSSCAVHAGCSSTPQVWPVGAGCFLEYQCVSAVYESSLHPPSFLSLTHSGHFSVFSGYTCGAIGSGPCSGDECYNPYASANSRAQCLRKGQSYQSAEIPIFTCKELPTCHPSVTYLDLQPDVFTLFQEGPVYVPLIMPASLINGSYIAATKATAPVTSAPVTSAPVTTATAPVTTAPVTTNTSIDQKAELSRTCNSFGVELSKNQASNQNNVLFSPYGIFSMLSMTLKGTKGETIRQLRNVMSLKVGQKLHKALRDLRRTFPTVRAADVTYLREKNIIYYQNDSRIILNIRFLRDMERWFGAKPEPFSQSNPEEEINDFVSRQTSGKIQNFFEGAYTEKNEVLLLLLNAIDFKGNWRNEFKNTAPGKFHTASKGDVDVTMMSQIGNYSVKAVAKGTMMARVLELPFTNDDRFSMFVLLPSVPSNLSNLEAVLNHEVLKDLLNNMPKESEYNVTMPQFSLTVKTSLKPNLQAMGITEMFKSQADLSAMASGKLKIYGVKQEAVFKVYKRKAIAAAAEIVTGADLTSGKGQTATAVTSWMGPTAAAMTSRTGLTASAVTSVDVIRKSGPTEFIMDHPFLVILWDKQSNLSLFMGKVYNLS